ncbi:MAG: hypothetical protein WC965_01070 [Thiohalomonadaceae bacterium]
MEQLRTQTDAALVSTVQLGRTLFETCLFFTDGGSEVVERYVYADHAVQGHQEWADLMEQVPG